MVDFSWSNGGFERNFAATARNDLRRQNATRNVASSYSVMPSE